jgi:hypothetical protein
MFEGRFGAIPSGDPGHPRPGVGALAAWVDAVDPMGRPGPDSENSELSPVTECMPRVI